ncbi:VPLPA-CTERM sorting domain-containing protein [Phycobacter azelaicus]|uniref:VPLPA-CTERM sorting domain-containing protein n=1 Tax=Phycobacter azelaicus TaxID=2668075 RepID=UPI001867B983|nr:VPLPA-CTERM sorting domain-containing protein [Phycobacter azelaicus]MBE1298062.1 VPLPA-CTERM sorting domain-containing protein [Paracoccaceae bacterium]
MIVKKLAGTVLALALSASSALAATVFDNGVVGSGVNRNVGNQYAVADDFTLSANTTVTGVQFAFGFTNSDLSQARLDIGIYDSAMNNLLLMTNLSVTGSQIATAGSYRIFDVIVSGLSLNLAAGSYWFGYKGVNSVAAYADWGVSAPAGNLRQSHDYMAFNSFSTYPREQQFSISGTSSIAPVPLPATGILLIGAFGGLGLLRRRRKA